MSAIQIDRFCEFRAVQNDLTEWELSNVADSEAMKVWVNDWVTYIQKGGDRPPRKPPTP